MGWSCSEPSWLEVPEAALAISRGRYWPCCGISAGTFQTDLSSQRRRAGTPYVELQEIYRFLEIGAERQTGHNAKRITELAEEVGWVKSRRRIGNSRVNAFFPDRATPTPPEEAAVRYLGADGVSRPF